MKFQQIHLIINPAARKEEPVLSYINQAFDNTGVDWAISITKKDESAGDIAKTLIGKTDLVAIYGGDGCVTAVASTLHGTATPMAIIPGGTANVMAKELGIPLDTKAALALLSSGQCQMKAVDMGLMNDQPFLLRVNLGIMADMVVEADRELKNHIGQLAYGVSAVKTMACAEAVNYKLEIDGMLIEETGVSLTITNSGNIGIGDFALQPGISINDGLLDVILLRDNSLTTILKVAGSTLLQNKTDAVQHWQCKEVVITMDKAYALICDDLEEKAAKLTISIIPASINIIVPANKTN